MGTKSKAQIARMIKRAAARGETYEPPQASSSHDHNTEDDGNTRDADSATDASDMFTPELHTKMNAAVLMMEKLSEIEADEDMKSKERRSAKRKAEAIAVESAGGCSVEELKELYAKYGIAFKAEHATKKAKEKTTEDGENEKTSKNPYIVFIGQLAYTTTKEGLFNYVKEELGDEHKVTNETVKIRLLTDAKTKKSRGMAFLETSDADLLYATLKLHHTMLDGRRLNVERSAGGSSSSEARKTKIQKYRAEQSEYVSETVNKMIEDYQKSGELQSGELDEGAIALCKRHALGTVESALNRYFETNGRDMDNPSAYFTSLITKISAEGVFESKDSNNSQSQNRRKQQKRPQEYDNTRTASGPKRRLPATETSTEHGVMGKKLMKMSDFAKRGVDMSNSESSNNVGTLAKIFPSMTRGRGRGGRGYM